MRRTSNVTSEGRSEQRMLLPIRDEGDVSRGKMWKVRGGMSLKVRPADCQGDSFPAHRRPSRRLRLRGRNLKEREAIISSPLLIRVKPAQPGLLRSINREDNHYERKVGLTHPPPRAENTNDAAALLSLADRMTESCNCRANSEERERERGERAS